jgi:hypothetical protein
MNRLRPTTHRPRSTRAALAAILGLALFVAACGEGGPSAEPTEVATQAPATTAAEPASETTAEAAVEPTVPQLALAADGEPTPIAFDEFYTRASIREGLKLTEKLLSLDGRKVVMRGYMAPPLKPELDFFVLTKVRLAYCPFCSTAAEWPDDIAVVYTPSPMKATERAVSVEGTIEIGSKMDQETGMVSLVRIYADKIGKL